MHKKLFIFIHLFLLLASCGNSKISQKDTFAELDSGSCITATNSTNQSAKNFYEVSALPIYCRCLSEPDLSSRIDCDTIFLKNEAILYWHFNCDSSWLTLETTKGNIVLDGLGEVHGYTYRIGYQLEKEFKNSMLFRYGCPANGPCYHILIDKTTGEKLKEYQELIYTGEDEMADFIVYFTNSSYNSVTIEFINNGSKKVIPFPGERINAYSDMVPEYNFNNTRYENGILYLPYQYKMDENDAWMFDSLIVKL